MIAICRRKLGLKFFVLNKLLTKAFSRTKHHLVAICKAYFKSAFVRLHLIIHHTLVQGLFYTCNLELSHDIKSQNRNSNNYITSCYIGLSQKIVRVIYEIKKLFVYKSYKLYMNCKIGTYVQITEVI